MGLRLFFLPNFPGATFIQGATFIPDSRVSIKEVTKKVAHGKINNKNVIKSCQIVLVSSKMYC